MLLVPALIEPGTFRSHAVMVTGPLPLVTGPSTEMLPKFAVPQPALSTRGSVEAPVSPS